MKVRPAMMWPIPNKLHNSVSAICRRLPGSIYAVICACFLLGQFGIGPAFAQNLSQYSRSYVTPFPDGDVYRLYVFGDSLGEGMGVGLDSAFEADGRVETRSKIKYSGGFTSNKNNWTRFINDVLTYETVHLAVIMVGRNDLRSIWTKKRRLRFGEKEWREEYVKRVDKLIKRLKKSNVAIYWVGLPIIRSPKINREMQLLNEIFRERAFLNGVKFIDTWNSFADQFGRYSAYGPDLTGKIKRLRANDGIHFTYRGNRKLAHFVEREIRRDFAAARTERNIPLAGSAEEQERAIRRKRVKKSENPAQVKKKSANVRGSQNPVQNKNAKEKSAWASTVRNKKAGSEVVTIGDIKIVRPQLPDIAVRSIIGSSSSRARTNLATEVLASDLDGDLTALGSVSSANALSLELGKQSMPLNQMPSYKVLIRGEKLKPKPGRADDFSWPKGSS